MITRTKLPRETSAYGIFRDGIYIGIVELHDGRYWRIRDVNGTDLECRSRTRKSAIAELDRITTPKEITT